MLKCTTRGLAINACVSGTCASTTNERGKLLYIAHDKKKKKKKKREREREKKERRKKKHVDGTSSSLDTITP
jgi:hypothetical protein